MPAPRITDSEADRGLLLLLLLLLVLVLLLLLVLIVKEMVMWLRLGRVLPKQNLSLP